MRGVQLILSDSGEKIQLHAQIPLSCHGQRLDAVLAELFSQYSRSNIKKWITNQMVMLDSQVADKANYKVKGGEQVAINAHLAAQEDWQGQALALEVVFEDDGLIVLNKPAGVVVHPAKGNLDGTLVNGLLHRYPELAQLPRAGIIHRLDKDTTGLLVVARHLSAHASLVEQLQNRAFKREYVCLVHGHCAAGGTVDEPIGRHPRVRTKMAVTESGKEAITHYRVVKTFQHYSLLRVKLETGRTHQIRVHLAHLHKSIIGDPVYGGRLKIPPGAAPEWIQTLRDFRRQALHARVLGLTHPTSGEWLEWTQDIPDDFKSLLEQLEFYYGVN